MGIVSPAACRRRADEYRVRAAKASDEKERNGLLSVCELLEHLARIEESKQSRVNKSRRWTVTSTVLPNKPAEQR
jgi:hypothetical protein